MNFFPKIFTTVALIAFLMPSKLSAQVICSPVCEKEFQLWLNENSGDQYTTELNKLITLNSDQVYSISISLLADEEYTIGLITETGVSATAIQVNDFSGSKAAYEENILSAKTNLTTLTIQPGYDGNYVIQFKMVSVMFSSCCAHVCVVSQQAGESEDKKKKQMGEEN